MKIRKRKNVADIVKQLENQGRLGLERKHLQHGTTTVFQHSVHVAYVSLALAKMLRLRVNRESLIRGALLHDYFLYDWHLPHSHRTPHGFTHPGTALRNAKRDYQLTPREENIIARHMFPLTPVPPTCREAWLVCLADKYCAIRETLLPSS